MEEKANLYIAEKTAIARYAASLLEEGDFVYLDAGTTTEKVIDFIPLKKITFVTCTPSGWHSVAFRSTSQPEQSKLPPRQSLEQNVC